MEEIASVGGVRDGGCGLIYQEWGHLPGFALSSHITV